MAWGDLSAITLTGDFTYPDGTATGAVPSGTITFDFPKSLLAIRDPGSNLIIVPRRIVARLDSSGQLKLAPAATDPVVLPASDDPDVSPTGWTYHVTETIVAAGVTTVDEYDIPLLVAGGSTQDLADIDHVESVDAFASYVTLADFLALEAEVVALGGSGLLDGGGP